MNTLRKLVCLVAVFGINAAWAATDTANLNITINIQPACTLDSVDAVSATHATGTSGAQSQSGQVRVTCNSGHTYTIAMGAGGNASGTQRRVKSGTNYVDYGLYRAGGATAWGTGGTAADNSLDGEGDWNGTGNGAQQVYGYEVSYNLGGTEAAGTYTDTVLVTLEF